MVMETKWLTATPEEQVKIEKWVNSLSDKNAALLELLVKEVREQAAADFIKTVEKQEWWQTLMADAMSFRLVKYIPSFRLITKI